MKISDHAIVRYLERVKGLDIEAIRKEILPEIAIKAVTLWGNGYYPIGGTHQIRVKNGSVITVLAKDMKIKQIRRKMHTRNKNIRKRNNVERKRHTQNVSADEQFDDWEATVD